MLLMACLLTTLWIRALRTADIISVSGDHRTAYVVASNQYGLMGLLVYPAEATVSLRIPETTSWWTRPNQSFNLFVDWPCGCVCIVTHVIEPIAFPDWETYPAVKRNCVLDKIWCGFHLGHNLSNAHGAYNKEMRYFVVPCWSLVTPLTLLSAYLILWKPRRLPPPKTENPFKA
jgi:hypothetical protein